MGKITRIWIALGLLLTVSSFSLGLSPVKNNVLLNTKASGVDYLLNSDVVPISYEVTLTPDLDTFKFTGEATINVKNEGKATNVITLHSRDLDYTEIKVGDDVLKPDLDPVLQKMTLKLPKRLGKGRTAVINAKYTGELSNDMHGLYKSSYQYNGDETQFIAATQFQPTHARRAFPCFDEPKYKANFKFTIIRDPQFNATLFNWPRIDQTYSETTGLITDVFDTTEKMSTYLVAFVVTDFGHIGDENFAVYAREEALDQAKYAYEVGPQLLKVLEKFTELDFPYKTDLIAIPDFSAGAMENWGLVTYRETALLYKEGVSTDRNKQRVASVVAHELAHMWFGDMITLNWWSNTWLNEGFARYFEYHATAQVEKTWELEKQFVVDQLQNVFGVDALTSAHPMSFDVYSPAEISNIFDSISYAKGGSVIRMMEHFLGHETFRKGLAKYLKKHQFTNTKPDDLFASLQEQADNDKVAVNISAVMKTWTEQSGYPVVYVEHYLDNPSGRAEYPGVLVKQQRFLLRGNDQEKGTVWKIPLSFTTQKESNFENTAPKNWLTEEQFINIPDLDHDWVIFNIQQTGYFRVNYSSMLWDHLLEGLKTNHSLIHELNRAQIVDDAMNLARAGHLKYDTAFNVFEYLRKETSYFPWTSAFNSISFIYRRLLQHNDLTQFEAYVKSVSKNLYEALGFDETKEDSQTKKFNRVNVLTWSCKVNEVDCTAHSVDLFSQWKNETEENPSAENPIPPNLRSIVYCTALKHGSAEDWDFLWNQYLTADVAAEQATILSSLGCTKNETILKEYLLKSIDPESRVRSQDAASIFTSVYSGSVEGIRIADEFLRENYKDIAATYGGMNTLGNCISGLASYFTTETQIQSFAEWLVKVQEDVEDIKVTADRAIESAWADLEWNKNYQKEVMDVIKILMSNRSSSLTSSMFLSLIFVLFAMLISKIY